MTKEQALVQLASYAKPFVNARRATLNFRRLDEHLYEDVCPHCVAELTLALDGMCAEGHTHPEDCWGAVTDALEKGLAALGWQMTRNPSMMKLGSVH